MDALTGFKVLSDEFIDKLEVNDDVKRVIRLANDLKQFGHTDQTGKFSKVDQADLMKLV